MKATRLVIACGLAAMLAGPVLANPQLKAPEARAERMQKVLQLNDAQREEVSAILARAAEQREAAVKKYTIAERQAFHKEMRGLHEETRKSIDAVLTEPQKVAMQTLHERGKGFKGRMHRHPGHHADHQGPDRSRT